MKTFFSSGSISLRLHHICRMVWVGDERFETQHLLYVPFRLSHPRPAKGKSSWRRGRRAWPTFFSILQSGTILMYFFCTGLELALSCAFYMLENRRCNVSVLCGRSLWSILFWLESIYDCSVQRAFKWKQSSEFWEIKTKTLKIKNYLVFLLICLLFSRSADRGKSEEYPRWNLSENDLKTLLRGIFGFSCLFVESFIPRRPFIYFKFYFILIVRSSRPSDQSFFLYTTCN